MTADARGNPPHDTTGPASLQDDIFAACARARREGDWQIAEILLQALEAIDSRDRGDAVADDESHRPAGPR